MTRRGTLESVIGGGLELLSTYAASKSLIILVGTKADLWEQYRHRGTAEQKQELINLDQASEVPNSLVLLFRLPFLSGMHALCALHALFFSTLHALPHLCLAPHSVEIGLQNHWRKDCCHERKGTGLF